MNLRHILIFACLILITNGKRSGGGSSRGSRGFSFGLSRSGSNSVRHSSSSGTSNTHRNPVSNNFGYATNSGVGWKIPSVVPKNTQIGWKTPATSFNSNVGSKPGTNLPNTGIGWKQPDIKKDTNVGSYPGTNLPNTGIGWKIPDVKKDINVGSQPGLNLPNTGIGWKIPDINRPTSVGSQPGSNLPNTGVGWKLPDIKKDANTHGIPASSWNNVNINNNAVHQPQNPSVSNTNDLPFNHNHLYSGIYGLHPKNQHNHVAENRTITKNELYNAVPNNTNTMHGETPKSSLFDPTKILIGMKSLDTMFNWMKFGNKPTDKPQTNHHNSGSSFQSVHDEEIKRAYKTKSLDRTYYKTVQQEPAQVFYDNVVHNNATNHKIINFNYLMVFIIVLIKYWQ